MTPTNLWANNALKPIECVIVIDLPVDLERFLVPSQPHGARKVAKAVHGNHRGLFDHVPPPLKLEIDELADWFEKNEYRIYHHAQNCCFCNAPDERTS